MNNICIECDKHKIDEIPLLVCGHYACNDCYVRLKSSKIYNCLICNDKLKRSFRKQRLARQIHELNMSYY
jgi:hypothetical protein